MAKWTICENTCSVMAQIYTASKIIYWRGGCSDTRSVVALDEHVSVASPLFHRNTFLPSKFLKYKILEIYSNENHESHDLSVENCAMKSNMPQTQIL